MNCYESARRVSIELLKKGRKMAVAESCTGGQMARTATTVVGSSSWFDVGFITYCNEAKMASLGVRAETLEKYTAVSKQVAIEMAAGALERSSADYALAVTGVAGPGGGTKETPVGQVYVALQKSGEVATVYRLSVSLDRHSLQRFVSKFAYDILHQKLLIR